MRPSYDMQIPKLQAQPILGECMASGERLPCVTLLLEDHETIIRELKAACLALGNTNGKCDAGFDD
jgi:hypothetical protein